MKIEPFLKWPGGKKWLVNNYGHLFPSSYDRYIEPFLGGGAVYFHLEPHSAILADSNEELINVYQCIKDNAADIGHRLSRLQKMHNKSLYYKIRHARPKGAIPRAVRFIYLNRTCFNGIYRVNQKGEFNVPMGTKTQVEYPSNYLGSVSNRLQHAIIRACDFEKTIDRAKKGDFIFIDPPYTVMHNSNNFLKYNASLFSWPDQLRLSASIRRASARGVLIMMSNADHYSVRELYGEFGFHFSVARASILAAEAAYRRKTTELVITNYKPQAKVSDIEISIIKP